MNLVQSVSIYKLLQILWGGNMANGAPTFMGFSVTPDKVSALKMQIEATMDSMQAPDYLRAAVNDGMDNIIAALNRFMQEKKAAAEAATAGVRA